MTSFGRCAGSFLAAVVLGGTLLACSPRPNETPADQGAATMGAPSIGDAYYPTDGNAGYDVEHYDLRLSYQPGADRLDGTATIRLTATQRLSGFSFDLGLDASSVEVDGTPATFAKRNAKLVVTPSTPLEARQQATVTVRYGGVPSKTSVNGESNWHATPDGAYSVSEPHLAAFWFPCNDHPLDKATYDVSVAVPDGTQVLSSGVLLGTTLEHGQTRWSWHSSRPQASYLEFLAIGQYEISNGTTPEGRPIIIAYDRRLTPALRAAGEASVRRTHEVVQWETTLFGPYPFEAEGGVVTAADDKDAEEFQTRPVYLSGQFVAGPDMNLVVHENAHQWFGDTVSVHGWRDIWLNEGFATFAEWLWMEHTGEATTRASAEKAYREHSAEDAFWQVPPADPGPERLLDDAVYNRGAMAQQALRTEVGDDAFFRILRDWVAEHHYGNGSTEQFVALAERVSGKPLGALFQTWLYTKGRPAAPAP